METNMYQIKEPLAALDVAPRAKLSNYPPVFAARMAGRSKRQLGDAYGLTRFGVNLVELTPGARSSLLHRHSRQQEFVFILTGRPMLRIDEEERELAPGMCIGFLPDGPAHCLVNRSDTLVRYLEIGDRDPEDGATYPEDDLVAERCQDAWRFVHRDGMPW
ncbi:MAG: cupin domain-containing protein [Sphingobium sp.]